MSRKMDSVKSEIIELSEKNDEATILRRKLKVIEDRQKVLKQIIISKMGTSVVGSIEGIDVFEVVPTERKSVPVENVYNFAPQLADVLININKGKTIKFLKVNVK
ncbi:hypothetical protein PBI_GRAYSON_130 [Rhodococcus phage Grayson]|nr:hypothetical protein PBI_GRAYSON_130 [Rhodococcus phage Grayson]